MFSFPDEKLKRSDTTPRVDSIIFPFFTPLRCRKKIHNVLVSSQQGKEFFVLVLTGATGREEEDPAEGGSEVKCEEIRRIFFV